MIDDRGGKQTRPVLSISFVDLEALGFSIQTQEFLKPKSGGDVKTAVKILEVTKDGKPFPRSYFKEFLHVLGIETLEENSKYWVVERKRHRCLTQKDPVYHYRVMGYERLDETHRQSGRCSHEAYMFASNFSDMNEQASKLANGGDDE